MRIDKLKLGAKKGPWAENEKDPIGSESVGFWRFWNATSRLRNPYSLQVIRPPRLFECYPSMLHSTEVAIRTAASDFMCATPASDALTSGQLQG